MLKNFPLTDGHFLQNENIFTISETYLVLHCCLLLYPFWRTYLFSTINIVFVHKIDTKTYCFW